MKLLAIPLAALLLVGCSSGKQGDAALDAASAAMDEAARANGALDSGSGSGTTMGHEIEELQGRMDAVEQENRQLRSEVEELESKISYLESQQRF